MKNINIVIISTYPREGTLNIGDALITNSTRELLTDSFSHHYKLNFEIIWRADKWINVKDLISNANLIVFAGLGIRKEMSRKIYPYLTEILKLDKQLLVISAGTSLGIGTTGYRFHLNEEDTLLLSSLNKNALGFTSRALLTQLFCEKQKLNNVWYSGDVAFYDNRFDNRKFEKISTVKKIVISDPHYPHLFLPALRKLVVEINILFPQAIIDINLHGKNPDIERFARKEKITINEIFSNPEAGLDNYDNYDLHVGFRIHGHISMLKRRKPSYLIEQDGRGKDYGISLNRRISVKSNFQTFGSAVLIENIFKKLLRIKNVKKNILDLSCIDEIIALISNDKKTSFDKFLGFENEVTLYNANHRTLVDNVINKI